MKRILIVDDDIGILDSLELVLEESYEILRASDGEEALERLSEGRVDLVLLDVLMPLMSGPDVMRHMRQRGVAVPVILLSAHAALHERAEELAADDFLGKPFALEELEEKIKRLLSRGGGSGGSTASGPKDRGRGGDGGLGCRAFLPVEARGFV